jgi:hypothetical protein
VIAPLSKDNLLATALIHSTVPTALLKQQPDAAGTNAKRSTQGLFYDLAQNHTELWARQRGEQKSTRRSHYHWLIPGHQVDLQLPIASHVSSALTGHPPHLPGTYANRLNAIEVISSHYQAILELVTDAAGLRAMWERAELHWAASSALNLIDRDQEVLVLSALCLGFMAEITLRGDKASDTRDALFYRIALNILDQLESEREIPSMLVLGEFEGFLRYRVHVYML